MSRGIGVQLLALLLSAVLARAHEGPVVVSGATGRTGALVYLQLKGKGVPVRALVRNATKARAVLGCGRCDASEGIFVADITDPATLAAPMRGAGALVVATSAEPVCDPYPKCHFPKGGEPIDVDWKGAKAQLLAFAQATVQGGLGQVVLISTMGTTSPDSPMDAFDHISFYKLNFEAELMSSGLPFTIVKPCGLIDTEPAKTHLLVGHDDELHPTPPAVSRADVARVVVAALQQPGASEGLRFDLCAQTDGTATTDDGLLDLLREARQPWQRRPAIATTAGEAVAGLLV